MQIIKHLSNNIIDQIKAGEVLQNPSSAIKELIENSIDANATEIQIELINAGKNQIIIKDNGVGMSKEDLKICYLRHTTSKFIDFDEIKTFGFRGEAIASIASVSKITITSKEKNDKYSNIITIDNGELIEESKGFDQNGTKIEIINLFYTVPARLNFLKSTNYELSLILKIIKQFAISSPHIHFICTHNNKTIFSTLSESNRIKLILGEHFLNNSMEINYVLNNIHIQGFASLPTYTKTNGDNKWIFVNNRLIQNKQLNNAISQAYKDTISFGAYPILFLHISMPLNEVDVNVHPQKKEVRFLNSNEVFKALFQSITSAIYKNGKKAIDLSNINMMFDNIPENKSTETFDEKEPYINYNNHQTFFTNSNNKNNINYHNIDKNNHVNDTNEDFIPNIINSNIPIDLGHAIGQLNNKYIIACKKDYLIIIDQHACHERILYEELKKIYYSKNITSQNLLNPIKTSIVEILDDEMHLIRQFGFELKKMNNIYYVTKHPIIYNTNLEQTILAIMNNKKHDINHILANISCHASIRSGFIFSIDEMNSFLRLIEQTEKSGQCNHGRPSYIIMHINKLDHLFNRV